MNFNLKKLSKFDFLSLLFISVLILREIFSNQNNSNFHSAISSFTFNLFSLSHSFLILVIISILIPFINLIVLFYDIYGRIYTKRRFFHEIIVKHAFYCLINCCILYLIDIISEFYFHSNSVENEWSKFIFHFILTPALFVDTVYTIEIEKIKYNRNRLMNYSHIELKGINRYIKIQSFQSNLKSYLELENRLQMDEYIRKVRSSNKNTFGGVSVSLVDTSHNNASRGDADKNVVKNVDGVQNSDLNDDVDINFIFNNDKDDVTEDLGNALPENTSVVIDMGECPMQISPTESIHTPHNDNVLSTAADNEVIQMPVSIAHYNFDIPFYSNSIYLYSQMTIAIYLFYCLCIVLFSNSQMNEIFNSILELRKPDITDDFSFYLKNLSHSAIECVFITLFFGLVDQEIILDKFLRFFRKLSKS
jgi:hypothetical protein